MTDRRRELLTERRLEGPADLVVEIVSESDPTLDYREKLPRYREARIPEIWLVDQFRGELLRERLDAAGYHSETLSSGRLSSSIIPGFWIEVSWLSQENLPSTLACLRQILDQ